MKKLKSLSKKTKASIITAAVAAIVILALVIVNIFIPVRYLFSYLVIRNKGAEQGVMRVRFVDVGHGDCIIVELPDGKNMLVGGGDGNYKNQSKILKILNKCDISTLDYLVCSSYKREYCGGLREIVKYKSVKNIYMPRIANTYITDEYNEFVLAANGSKAEIHSNEFGEGVDGGDYFFAFLSSGDFPVLWLEYAGAGFMLTGSAKSTQGVKILDDYFLSCVHGTNFCEIGSHAVKIESCKVLQLSSHGANDGASTPLFDVANPDYSVVSVGENGMGLPSMDALSLALEGGKTLYRTDEHGDILFSVTADGNLTVE